MYVARSWWVQRELRAQKTEKQMGEEQQTPSPGLLCYKRDAPLNCHNFFWIQNAVLHAFFDATKWHLLKTFIFSNMLTYVLQQLAIHGCMFYYISHLFCKVIVFTGPAFLYWKFWPGWVCNIQAKCILCVFPFGVFPFGVFVFWSGCSTFIQKIKKNISL